MATAYASTMNIGETVVQQLTGPNKEPLAPGTVITAASNSKAIVDVLGIDQNLFTVTLKAFNAGTAGITYTLLPGYVGIFDVVTVPAFPLKKAELYDRAPA